MSQENSESVTGAWNATSRHGVVTGGMASSVHSLLQCILWHGKLITKLLLNPFVNGYG